MDVTILPYITTMTHMVRVVLVVEREEEEEGHTLKVQWPVNFIHKVLSDSKTHYS